MITTSEAGTADAELARIRARIDDLDDRLVELIAERSRLATETLAVKDRGGLPRTDVRREAQVVARAARQARARGLDGELVRDVFWRLIELSRSAARSARAP